MGKNYQKYKRVRAKTQKAILDNGIDKPIKLKTFGFFERVFANRKIKDGSYERKENFGHGLMAYKKEPKYKFDGNLYVFISPITYSGGSELSNMIYTNDLGIFVGEETGGGYHFHTGQFPVLYELPNSKIMFGLSLVQINHYVKDSDVQKGQGILPDIEIELTREDLIQGRDSQLDYIIRKQKKDKNN